MSFIAVHAQLLALRDNYRRIEFTAAIGGTADMSGRIASANSVGFLDPSRTSAR